MGYGEGSVMVGVELGLGKGRVKVKLELRLGLKLVGDRLVSSSSSATMPRKSVCITAVDSRRSATSLEQFPVFLKKYGRLTGFVHRPMIDESVKPVRQVF